MWRYLLLIFFAMVTIWLQLASEMRQEISEERSKIFESVLRFNSFVVDCAQVTDSARKKVAQTSSEKAKQTAPEKAKNDATVTTKRGTEFLIGEDSLSNLPRRIRVLWANYRHPSDEEVPVVARKKIDRITLEMQSRIAEMLRSYIRLDDVKTLGIAVEVLNDIKIYQKTPKSLDAAPRVRVFMEENAIDVLFWFTGSHVGDAVSLTGVVSSPSEQRCYLPFPTGFQIKMQDEIEILGGLRRFVPQSLRQGE